MKTKRFLWVLLPMMAAALMTTACSSDDDSTSVSPKPAADQTVKSIPYTVTVGQGTTTRAGVASDDVTLKFAEGDKLYVQDESGNVYASLDMESNPGAASATFTGYLYYTGSAPAADLMLTATLVGKDDQLATVSDSKVTGFKAYPTSDNICATLADAVAKFSKLQGKNNYGAKSFALSQQTAFLKFKVNLEDGTTPGYNKVNVTVKDGNKTLGTGTTVASGTEQFTDTYAEFVLPAADNTSVSTEAKMWVGSVGTPTDESIDLGGNNTLAAGKVYEVAEKKKDFVRLWANGPLWATKNLGAGSVTYYGKYYAWGEVKGFYENDENKFYWDNYKYSQISGDNVTLTKYNATDKKTTLETGETGDDAARKTLGSPWRMPTGDEFSKLVTETTYAWTTVSGVTGGKFTGKGDYEGNAMFLRAGGYRKFLINDTKNQDGRYWSSSLTPEDRYVGITEPHSFPQYARFLLFDASEAKMSSYLRCNGRLIRPVR